MKTAPIQSVNIYYILEPFPCSYLPFGYIYINISNDGSKYKKVTSRL